LTLDVMRLCSRAFLQENGLCIISLLRGEGWEEGAKGEKTQEPIMSMYNQVAINNEMHRFSDIIK
jgi:hypothetical protein